MKGEASGYLIYYTASGLLGMLLVRYMILISLSSDLNYPTGPGYMIDQS